MHHVTWKLGIAIILLSVLTSCRTYKVMNDYAVQTHRFDQNLPEVTPKRWRPAGNNYFIDQIKQRKLHTTQAPLLENQIENRKDLQNIPIPEPKAKALTYSSSVDDRIIDSYSYSPPEAKTKTLIENLSPEQFMYEKESLEKGR